MSADGSAPAVAPSRPRAAVLAVRAFSWPLALLALVAGGLVRALAVPLHALRARGPGDEGAVGPLRRYATAAARWLSFRTDRFPPLVGRVPPDGESPGPWHEARRRMSKSPVALAAWAGIVLYLYVGIGAQAGWVAPSWESSQPDLVYARPQGLGHEHVLGTEQIGRDVASLALRGTLTALWIGTFAALLACVLGTVLGAAAGYFGGWVDALILWVFTTIESIPELLLLLSFAYVLRKNPSFSDFYADTFLATDLHVSVGLFTIVLALGLTSWTGVCRTVRAEFIRHRDRDYVVAAKALGVPTRRVLFRHILPNVFHLVLISFSLIFIGAVKSEVILTFLGLGLDAGEASWGQMINHAKLELTREPSVWWQLGAATVFMFGLVLAVNLFVDALRDALDPRLKH